MILRSPTENENGACLRPQPQFSDKSVICMLLAGIQAESGLDPRLKHSGVTIWSRIASPQPQFSKEDTKSTRFKNLDPPILRVLRELRGEL